MRLRFFLPILLAGLALPCAHAAAQDPAELTPAQWREDLAAMAAELRTRHPNPFHQVDEATFEAAVADLQARIPQMQRNEVIVGMMRIAALIGDGHTRVDPRKDAAFRFPSLPIKLYLFEDGLFVRAARPEQRELIGARVTAIGGVPVDEALRRAGELVSVDTPMGRSLLAPLYLAMPDVLQALGMSDNRSSARLTVVQGGQTRTLDLAATGMDPPWPPDTDISLITPEGWVDGRGSTAPPGYLAAPLEYHRLIELPERSAVYAQLNMVADTSEETLDAFGRRIREAVERTGAKRLVFDLRLNLGGNGMLRNGLVSELIRANDADTRLYVLTGRGTFSASQFILDDLDRLTDAVFVGEAASSKPTSYGDSYRIKLPNSGIALRTSMLYWQSEQNKDPWTWVDVGTPLTFADYAGARDPALEAALSDAQRPAVDRILSAAYAAGGQSAVTQKVAELVASPANRFADMPGWLTAAAEKVYEADNDAGLAIARSAAQTLPGDIRTQLYLAYLAESSGMREEAAGAAARALAIDPNDRFAREVAERTR